MRVLVIDDDAIARELLCSTLQDAGHEVFELPSAIGATRMLQENDIQAAVIDVSMPDVSGDKLVRLLRQKARTAQLAIVLVSSRSETELQSLADAAGADAVVTKKRIRHDLCRGLSTACERRGRGRLAT